MKTAPWLWRVALCKAVQNSIKVFLASYGSSLAGSGVTIDEAKAIAAAVAALEVARNFLKVKHGWKWL